MAVIVPNQNFSVKHDPSQGTGGFLLENDEATPGANKVYGTDGSGTKGWKDDPSGGSGGGESVATLTVDGTTMVVTYLGSSPPVLTEPSGGNYNLSVPAGTRIKGFDWDGDNTSTDGSGDLTLVIASADNDNSFLLVQVINGSNDQIADLTALGVVISQGNAVAGEVTLVMTSMSGFGASGFKVMARAV